MLRVKKLIKDFDYKGEFLSGEDLTTLFDGLKFGDFSDLINYLNDEDGNYIGDKISELSDGMVDIYYYNLRNWSLENYNYINEAVNEIGIVSDFDFHKVIQLGQYYAYTQEFYKMVSDFKEFLKNNYKF